MYSSYCIVHRTYKRKRKVVALSFTFLFAIKEKNNGKFTSSSTTND